MPEPEPAPLHGETVRLRDGTPLVVRPVEPDDRPLFERGFAELSDDSRYRRFLGFKTRLSETDLARFTHPDHRDHEALGALDPATGSGVAVARFVREPAAPETAEAAVVVVDAWQGRGVGSMLLERLARRAVEEGVRRFCATLLTGNTAMVRSFEHLGRVEIGRPDAATVALHVDLPIAGATGAELSHALRTVAESDLQPAPEA